MRTRILTVAISVGLAFALLASPSLAQKSKDTLRVAYIDHIKRISIHTFGSIDSSRFYYQIHDPLVIYNDREKKFYPGLAKSWRRIGKNIIEFDLRDDIKFHNGSRFGPEDVVYTVAWLKNKNTRIPFKGRHRWMKRAEKVGPHKVRIHTNGIYAADLLRVASVLHIFDSDLHKSLKSQYGYGLKAVGTGRYKLASFKKGRIVLVRNEDYNVRRKPFIKRIDAKQIPDAQTQTAEFMTGNLDVLMRPTIEMIKNMGKSPNVRFTTAPGASVTYVLFDSKGRSGRKEMTDLRVRKAIAMAVDRSAMAKHLGPRKAKALDSLCLKVMKACNSSTKPPAFDVAAAKRLMAEAGYAKGFDVTLYTRPLTKDLAVNAAGYLRQIGIKAKVESIGALAAMRKIRSAGKFELFLGLWPSDSTPDASNTLNLFFRKGATDYARDPLLHKITKLGVATYDLNKRKAFYRQAYDRINNQLYWLPLISWPITWLHSKDVEYTLEGASIFLSPHLSNFKWSK